MVDILSIAQVPELLEYIQNNISDFWLTTPFAGYRHMDNKQKGQYGEKYTELLLKSLNHDVQRPLKEGGGHDLMVNGIRTEVKFSLAHTDKNKGRIRESQFTMNHVSAGKDWERLIFVGINFQTPSVVKFMEKKSFLDLIGTEEFSLYFSRQQGGADGSNDDYISSAIKLRRLLASPHMKDIEYF